MNTGASGINARGFIAGGWSELFKPTDHGFVREPSGHIISFDSPVGSLMVVRGINNAEVITGYYLVPLTQTSARTFGFVRDPHGKFTSFDPGFATVPRSINNEGAITGFLSDTEQNNSSFVRSPEGTITIFDPPFCQAGSTMPESINDKGVITGYCVSASGPQVGWVRFP
jgi:hypothetical protein